MFGRRALFFLLLLFSCVCARADIFTVISNADSGPGTLRDALARAEANGSTAQDFIIFSLPDISPAGRTITLHSELPRLSNNLVIDGTTQAGLNWGVSGAKIKLYFDTDQNTPISGIKIIDCTDVVVAGLYITKLHDNFNTDNTLNFNTGIEIINSRNIAIGLGNQGNVVDRFYFPITTNFFASGTSTGNLFIKGNIFGVADDGKTLSITKHQESLLEGMQDQVVIGGTDAERNYFATGLSIYQGNSFDESPTAIFMIKNNYIGVDHDALFSFDHGLDVATHSPAGKNTINIEDNVLGSTGGMGTLWITNSAGKLTLLRNYIGTDKTRTHKFDAITGIQVFDYQGEVQIGSNNPADANVVGYCKPLNLINNQKVSFNKNSFFCVTNVSPVYSSTNYTPITTVEITSITANSVSGKATPNATIELFYADNCGTCAPETYFASATADAAGNWQYNGNITGTVIASATFNGVTSEFTQAKIDVTNLRITYACDATGSIIGAVPGNARNVKWLDQQGNIVGTQPDLLNVAPGKYQLVAENGACSTSSLFYDVLYKVIIDAATLVNKNASCGNSDGAITGINIINNTPDPLQISWKDGTGQQRGTTADLTAIPAGRYTLTVTTADGCQKTYGPVSVTTPGAPVINQTNQIVKAADCNQSTGAITGVTATGGNTVLQYSWRNAQNFEVGTTANLNSQPTGKYTLEVTDNTPCGTVYSTEVEIPELSSLTLNTTNVSVRSATCGQNNGFVKGLQAPGATQFVWTRADGSVAGNTIDLENIGAGDYRLTYSNANCNNIADFRIDLSPPTVFPDYPAVTTKTCFDFPTGTVTVNTDGFAIQPGIMRWINSQGTDVGFGKSIQFMPAGVYTLYLTDGTGCESLYKTYTIESYPELAITKFGTITNINCGLGKGSITATTFTGGTGNYVYEWLDANGVVIGTAPSIQNLEVGSYTLRFTDGGCNLRNLPFSIIDAPSLPPTPVMETISLCTAGNTTIRVQEPFATAIYRLYDTEISTQPIDEQIGGLFTVNVDRTRSYYVSLTYGTCEGARAEVKVAVGLTGNNIPNTFTPNGDGTNDFWKIADLGNYPNVTVSVFNRAGLQVYQSRGYGQPFDGTYQGKALPAGAYYYIIRLSSACNIISGNVNIIR